MRKKKWLIIVIGIILFINLSFFVFVHFVDFNAYVGKIISEQISKKIKADISFSKVNLNFNFLQFSDVSIIDNNDDFHFSAKQLYFKYNLLKVFTNRFNIIKAITEIRCFSPELLYNFRDTKKNISSTQKLNSEEIEKLLSNLSYISIINGKFYIKCPEDNISFNEGFDDVNLTVEKNKAEWNINLSAVHSYDKGKINIKGIYNKEDFYLNLQINDFSLVPIITDKIKIHNGIVNLNLPIINGKIDNGTLTIDSLRLEIDNNPISSENIHLKFYEDELIVEEGSDFCWNDCKVFIKGRIINYLNKNSVLDLELNSEDIELTRFNNQLNGFLSIKGKIFEEPSNPRIDLNLQAESITYNSNIIKNISTKMSYKNNVVELISGDFQYKDNPVNFYGKIAISPQDIKNSNINMIIQAAQFIYPIKNIELQADIKGRLTGNLQNPNLLVDISETKIAQEKLELNNFGGEALFIDNILSFTFANQDESITIYGEGSNLFKSPDLVLSLKSNNLSLNKLFKEKFEWLKEFEPYLDSDIKVSINNDSLKWSGVLNFPQNSISQVNGKVVLSGNIPLKFSSAKGKIEMYSDGLKIKDQNYSLDIIAETKSDTLLVKKITVNDALFLTGQLSLPVRGESIDYKGVFKLSDFSIGKIYNILSLVEDNEIRGNINGEVRFTSLQDNTISGNLHIDGFSIDENIGAMDVSLSFNTKDSILCFDDIAVLMKENMLFDGNARVTLNKNKQLYFYGNGKNIVIQNCMLKTPIQGIINYELLTSGTLQNPHILCNVEAQNGNIFQTKYDTLSIQFFQDSKVFYLNNFRISQGKEYFATAKGKYGYNFLKKEYYDTSDKIIIEASGDLFSVISEYIEGIIQASSKSNMNLTLITEDGKPYLQSGEFVIENGEMKIRNQPEKFKDINFDIVIKNNYISIINGSMKIGDGNLLISNNFDNEARDIIIGDLHLGEIFLSTKGKGLSVHLPVYMPERDLVKMQLEGFDDNYFRIYNDEDTWNFFGKILMSNGNAIYKKAESKSKQEYSDFLPPIHLNIDIVFKKNIWYVSKPFHLEIDKENFICLRSNPESDKIELFFELHSHRGQMCLFGEIFQAENVKVSKSKSDEDVHIDAVFKKKTPDGSTIFLNIKSTDDIYSGDDIGTDVYGKVKITVRSDNPKDITLLSILSKLHYGREISELTEKERVDLGREEAIILAGDELQKILLEPVLMQLESTVRQFFGLDFFSLKTGFMRNIIKESGLIVSDNNMFPEKKDESTFKKISDLSKDVLLDDLSVSMGKYITPDWYINYEALVKKELTPEMDVKIGVQHEVSFTYDLPYNFYLKYLYIYSPKKGEDTQRITLEKVIHFF
ncbi:MAG: hypothetical protein ISS28_01525 [Candidatus Cloacimonetes bacterium]|nr:hypothetical protein [Candidatus Cloacimonadota bacterium]MBL7085767.1 hypothetical protein [Candidatus Cloacimonadota bacterium]